MLESLLGTEKQGLKWVGVCNSLQREIYALINLTVAFPPGLLHLFNASPSALSEKRMSFKGSSGLDTWDSLIHIIN